MNEIIFIDNIDGVNVMGADPEFIEYVKDSGYEDEIELEELFDLLTEWVEEA